MMDQFAIIEDHINALPVSPNPLWSRERAMGALSDLRAKLQAAEIENTRLRDAMLHIRGVAATDGFVTVAWLIDRCDAALEVRK